MAKPVSETVDTKTFICYTAIRDEGNGPSDRETEETDEMAGMTYHIIGHNAYDQPGYSNESALRRAELLKDALQKYAAENEYDIEFVVITEQNEATEKAKDDARYYGNREIIHELDQVCENNLYRCMCEAR
jgi:hypothetical protein